MPRWASAGRGLPWRVSVAAWVLLSALQVLPARAETLRDVDLPGYTAEIEAAQATAARCGASAGGCDSAHVPERVRVRGAAHGNFIADWHWFVDTLTAAKTQRDADRRRSMENAAAHLRELLSEATAGNASAIAGGEAFTHASAAARTVLARPEFRSTAEPTWWARTLARLEGWLLRMFSGVSRVGRRAPWLAPLIEWSCFGLAAAGLLWFVRQSLMRQALRISLAQSADAQMVGNEVSANWQRLAQEAAAAGNWREGIHCLYWAAIAAMEGRRAWKPNPTRTPREYLQLLQPEGEARGALSALTRQLERTWYGHAEATETDFRNAQGEFDRLRTARERRGNPSGCGPAAHTLAQAGGA